MKDIRHNDPDYYLLTDAQASLLLRFSNVLNTITPKYTKMINNRLAWEINPELIRDLLSALRKKRISFDAVAEIADTVLSSKWYTLIVAGDIPAKGEQAILFYLITSESNGKASLVPEDNEYYKIFHSSDVHTKERKVLGLSPEHKFLFASEYLDLITAADIKKAMVAPEDSEGNWIIKSSPLFTPFVYSGKKNAAAGKMESKGNTIFSLSGGKIKWEISNDFLAISSNKRAQDLLDYFSHIAAISGYNSTCVYAETKDIKKLWNVSDNKNFNEQLINALKILDNAKISGTTYRGDFDNKRISQDSTKLVRGKLIFYFTDEWLAILKATKENLAYSPLIQALPVKNCSKPIARKFFEHMRNNAGESNQFRLSVQSLLAVTDLPAVADLERVSQASQRIIKPFNDSLDDIKNYGIFSFRYLKHGGKKLSPQEEKQAKTDYYFWADLIIEIYDVHVNYSILEERKAARKEITEKEAQQPKKKRGRPRKSESSPSGNVEQ